MKTTLEKRPNTAFIPVTVMEEVPVLSASERDELLASLRKAEGEIATGQFVEHDPNLLLKSMTSTRQAATTKKAI